MVILENIDIDIDIDKAILQNIDIDKISNRFKFGISNRAMKARHSRAPPDLTTLRGLVFDELDRKYRHERHLKYAEDESTAISWYLREKRRRPIECLYSK